MNLTLYQIESGLAQLIEYRASRMADTEEPPTQEELDAIEGEIRKYEFREPAKVAGVAAIFRSWRTTRETAAAEAKRYRAIAKAFEGMEARLKECVGAVLELLPAPAKGCRTLTGADGSKLMLKGNGGVEPLVIDGWDAERECWMRPGDMTVLPPEYRDVTVRLKVSDWMRILSLPDALVPTVVGPIAETPSGARIREALALPCGRCEGVGTYPEDDPARMTAEALNDGATIEALLCSYCGGTGKQRVPGARLLPRGSHVEFK